MKTFSAKIKCMYNKLYFESEHAAKVLHYDVKNNYFATTKQKICIHLIDIEPNIVINPSYIKALDNLFQCQNVCGFGMFFD